MDWTSSLLVMEFKDWTARNEGIKKRFVIVKRAVSAGKYNYMKSYGCGERNEGEQS